MVQSATSWCQLRPGDQLLALASETPLLSQTSVQKVWGCNVGHPGAPGLCSHAVKLDHKAKYDSRQVVRQVICSAARAHDCVKAGRCYTESNDPLPSPPLQLHAPSDMATVDATPGMQSAAEDCWRQANAANIALPQQMQPMAPAAKVIFTATPDVVLGTALMKAQSLGR